MRRIATVLALLVSTAEPALAGGDWDDEDAYYAPRHWRGDYRADYGGSYYAAPAYEVYIPYYGAYFADDPSAYGPDCKVERKWRHGRYKEKIECDDD